MNRQDYVVAADRFLLDDPGSYLVRGILPDQCEVTAMLDQKQLESSVFFYPSAGVLSGVRTNPSSDQKYAGVMVKIPEDRGGARRLSIWFSKDGQKERWFQISAAALWKRRGKPQFYIEDEYVDGNTGILHVGGWAAAKTHVKIRFYDEKSRPIRARIERGPRSDVKNLFSECEVELDTGFRAQIENARSCGSFIYMVMKTEEGERLVRKIGVSPLQHIAEKAGYYYDRTARYVEINGVANLLTKGSRKAAVKVAKRLERRYPSIMQNRFVNRVREQAYRPMSYEEFLPKHLPSEQEKAKQRNKVFDYQPKISVVVPLYMTDPWYLEQLVDSVRKQTYSNWELCLSDGSGPDSPLREILDRLEESEPRIRVIRNPEKLRIAQNTNAGIQAATGDYIGFADHDDVLTDDALYEVVKLLNEDPEAELIYSDEDKTNGKGNKFFEPQFKPDYNPDLLYTVNYICHFMVVKRELLDKAGLLRPEFDGAQDYDLVLRCTEQTEHIRHIPRILYHWRAHEQSTSENPESKGYAFEAGRMAIQAHFDRCGIPAAVSHGQFPGLYRTKYLWPENPLVSILIPNKDHIEDLDKCIRSILDRSSYRNYEIIVIENNSTEPETFAYYERFPQISPRLRLVTWEGPFNYSAINNFGAEAALGDYYLLLNNDTEVINEDWIEELLGYCQRPDVGIVGARLYYGDDTIQHAGVVFGFGSIAGHCFVQQPRQNTGYCHRIICAQDYSAVTAACMMVRKDVFDEVEGLSTDLAVAFNDVDFCLKVRHAGYLVVYNPYCELYHYESKSRGLEDTPEKIERFGREIMTVEKHWPGIFQKPDPYYNPNLTLESQDFSLKRI